MPTFDRTRTTSPVLAFAAGFGAAIRADAPPAVVEVFPVLGTVAVDAKRDAVGWIEAQLRELCKRLDVVRVKSCTNYAASLAGVPVALQYRRAPLGQLRAQSRAFSFERLTILPRRCKRPDFVNLSARAGAIHPPDVRSGLESVATIQAGTHGRSVRPTRLTTELRSIRSAGVLFVLPFADGACERNSGTAAEDRSSFDRWHMSIIPSIDPRYCDVIVRRWEEFTGKKAVLDGNEGHTQSS